MRRALFPALLLACLAGASLSAALAPALAQTTVVLPAAPPPVVIAPPGPAVPAAAPPPIALSGDGQHQDVRCTGQDVLLRGNGNNATLHGGCRSVTVEGNGNQVQAELQPGAPITLTGADNDLAFVLVAPGPDPLVRVSAGSDRAYRVTQLGAGGAPVATPRGVVVPGGGHVQVTEMPSVPELMQDLGARQTPRGTLVTLHADVLFDFDKTAIRPDAAASLTRLGQLIAQTHPPSVSITGYTDSIGPDGYNIGLSLRRAESVEHWLADQDHVQANYQVFGRGKADPVAPNTLPDGRDNPAGRQQNRRVEILLAHG